MDRTRVNLALLTVVPFLLAGCEHAMWGNVTALGMTFCLFFGTLQLGRRAPSHASMHPGDATSATAAQGTPQVATK